MKIYVTSIFVDDQDKAQKFYCDKLGFEVKNDIPLGTHRWLTVVSPEQPDGTELLLEPSDHRAVGPYKQALVEDGIAAHSFQVEDLDAEVHAGRADDASGSGADGRESECLRCFLRRSGPGCLADRWRPVVHATRQSIEPGLGMESQHHEGQRRQRQDLGLVWLLQRLQLVDCAGRHSQRCGFQPHRCVHGVFAM